MWHTCRREEWRRGAGQARYFVTSLAGGTSWEKLLQNLKKKLLFINIRYSGKRMRRREGVCVRSRWSGGGPVNGGAGPVEGGLQINTNAPPSSSSTHFLKYHIQLLAGHKATPDNTNYSTVNNLQKLLVKLNRNGEIRVASSPIRLREGFHSIQLKLLKNKTYLG